MDILLRLRFLLWAMVLCLWGLMAHQFLQEDEGQRMRWVASRLAVAALPRDASPPRRAGGVFPPRPPDEVLTTPPPALTAPARAAASRRRPAMPARRLERRSVQPPRPAEPAAEDPPVPRGFFKTQTRHFNVYAEGAEADPEVIRTLENLHANLMLDLAAFSPWARDERVLIFLFRDQESYRRVTGRPAWSGGASSVKRRKIYAYQSEELPGILAHELCHIYFDSFFIQAGGNPLWLSEGMATLVQTERGLAAPNWLKENLRILGGGGGYPIEELARVESTSGAADDDVRLWYTQAYSIVRFMVRSQYRSSFYHFCRHLRDGVPMAEALHRAYGMPFNRVKALEYAWRHDLRSRRTN